MNYINLIISDYWNSVQVHVDNRPKFVSMKCNPVCLNVCEKLCHQGKRGYSQRSVHKVSCKNKMPRFQLPPVNFQAVMKATEIRLPERKMCLSHLEVSVKKKPKD